MRTWVWSLLHALGLLLVHSARSSGNAALWSSEETWDLGLSRAAPASKNWSQTLLPQLQPALVLVLLAPSAWWHRVTAGGADAEMPCDPLSSTMCTSVGRWVPRDRTTMVKEMWCERTRVGGWRGSSADAPLRTDPNWRQCLSSVWLLSQRKVITIKNNDYSVTATKKWNQIDVMDSSERTVILPLRSSILLIFCLKYILRLLWISGAM